ncbi:diguanylate cyclase [Modestobacter sp. I12A-02662]|uniref:GGDEF domain-containing protein n=1 Tax=Modestobacter sp. I12A-02662 TaxID=1730496 RepID=UPI0034DE25ED
MSDTLPGAPQAMEMVPLADRLRWMLGVRLAVVLLPMLAWLVTGDRGDRSPAALLVPGAVLLAVGLLMHRFSGRGRRWAVAAITVPVMLDAVYLGWALYLTGGIAGPVVHVIVVHVLAVTLLGSFRTGLKLAFWHSLVVMSVLEAVSTGVLPGGAPGLEFHATSYGIFLVVTWATALTTAVLAAVNERELRRRRYDEAALRRLSAALHEAGTGVEVAEALLAFTVDAADAPVAALYCRRADDEDADPVSLVVRVRESGSTEVLRTVAEPAPGSLVATASGRGRTMLAAVRESDPWVDEVLDGAARVVAVPFGIDGQGRGVLAFEDHARAGSRIEHRRVAVVEQAVAHAATALARVRLLEHLQRSALTDGLTGVANRRAFDAAFHRELSLAGRTDSSLAVVILDLDRFKALNDTYGHLAGDDVLRAVGAALRQCTRQGDLVARYGGEEFVLLLPGATERDVIGAARRVRVALRGVPGPRQITASLGIAVRPDQGGTVAELLAAADQALYAAKQGGRDQARLAGRKGAVSGGDGDEVLAALPLPRAPEVGALPE